VGGIVCAIRRNAVLKFQTVPTSKGLVQAFDAQMRNLINSPGIAEAIAENEALGYEVCEILEHKVWSKPERERLLTIVNELYEHHET
jgi:hypothetical protein